MKKILVRSLIVLVVLLIVAVVTVGFFLGSIVKKGVETVGPQITKVDIKLDSVTLSLLSGSAKVKGLIVGNPEGYKAPQAISVGVASVSVNPGSVLSDKIVVRSIVVEAPEITFEGDPMNNNLAKILDNVNAATGGGEESKKPPQEQTTPGKKLQVDDFVITKARVHIGPNVVSIPDIHLTGLGTGPEGITAADLTQRALSALVANTLKAVASSAADIGKGATQMLGTNATKSIEKGIGDLFKKK